MIKLAFLITLAISSTINASQSTINFSIEKYQPERDQATIIKILDDHSNFLRYENLGRPTGTTEKYLTSTKYITDVLRIDDKTVGFINYIAYDLKILTFNFGTYGFIHLIGVDKDHQHKGYGRQLLKRAVAELEKLNTPSIGIAVNTSNSNALELYQKEGFLMTYPNDPNTQAHDIILMRKLNIPKDKLPKGNLIQQYPKTTLTLVSIIGCGLLFLKSKRFINYKANL